MTPSWVLVDQTTSKLGALVLLGVQAEFPSAPAHTGMEESRAAQQCEIWIWRPKAILVGGHVHLPPEGGTDEWMHGAAQWLHASAGSACLHGVRGVAWRGLSGEHNPGSTQETTQR